MKIEKTKRKNQPTVLVLGGYGFIGRHVTEQLENLGAITLVGTRGDRKPREPGCRVIALQKMNQVEDWYSVLTGVNIVVNAVGILRQRKGESYDHVHHLAVASLVKACEHNNVRLVHVSALGLGNPVKSRFLLSKRLGEKVITCSSADWRIVRPSLVDGEGGYGAKWLRRMASWPVHAAPANATGLLAPINARDLGEAIAKIALTMDQLRDANDRIFEVGGNRVLTMFDYLEVLKSGPPKIKIRVPALVARLASHLFDLLHVTPLSFGHYELLKFDNLPGANRIHELLTRPPLDISANL